MTIASLVVDVYANTVKLQQDVEKIHSQLDKVQSMATSLGKALIAAFSVTAIVQAGREVIAYTDHLQDLSEKSGMSTTGIQKLTLAFQTHGVEIDAVIGAHEKLAKNLVGGDKSTAGALEKLGLSIQALKSMAPEDQFTAVADAIGKIPNPTERAYAAMTVFGKGGVALLAGLDGHLKETTDGFEKMGLIIDEKTVKAGDDFGDTLGLVTKQLLGVVAAIIGPLLPALTALLNLLMPFWRLLGQIAGTLIDWVAKGLIAAASAVLNFGASILELAQRIPVLGTHLGVAGDAAAWLRDKAKESDAVLVKMFTSTADAGIAAHKTGGDLLGLGKEAETAAEKAQKLREELAKMAAAVNGGQFDWQRALDLDHLEHTFIPQLESRVLQIRQLMATMLTPTIHPTLNVSGGVTQGPVSITGAAQADIYDQTTTKIEKMNDALSGVSQVLGGIQSKWAQMSVVAVRAVEVISTKLAEGDWVGALVAAGAALGQFIGKLFGKTEESSKVSPVRDELFKLQGGLETLNPKVLQLTGSLDLVEAIFKAKTVAEYTKAVKDLQDALAFSDQAMQTLTQTTQKYGFTLEELGPALQRQNLDQQAQTLYQDFQVLTAAGVDHIAVLTRMADGVNQYIQNAIAMGVEVPAAMQPMLQQMVDQGLLTDAAGNKITDLSATGITFTETMTQGFQKIVDAVEKLTDAISRGLGLAIANIPQPQVRGHVSWDVDSIPPPDFQTPQDGAATGGLVTSTGIQHFAFGGTVLPFRPRGTDTVPAMLTPGEMVLNAGQQRAVRALMGGGGSQRIDLGEFKAMRAELSALRQELATQARRAPEQSAIAIRDALIQAGVGRRR